MAISFSKFLICSKQGRASTFHCEPRILPRFDAHMTMATSFSRLSLDTATSFSRLSLDTANSFSRLSLDMAISFSKFLICSKQGRASTFHCEPRILPRFDAHMTMATSFSRLSLDTANSFSKFLNCSKQGRASRFHCEPRILPRFDAHMTSVPIPDQRYWSQPRWPPLLAIAGRIVHRPRLSTAPRTAGCPPGPSSALAVL